jgi:hypothetical protein
MDFHLSPHVMVQSTGTPKMTNVQMTNDFPFALAAYLPARKASLVDPVAVLRQD